VSDNQSFLKFRPFVKRKEPFSANGSVCADFTGLSFGGLDHQPEGEAMPRTPALPNHLRPRREKMFGDGRPRPLDRNGKVRVMTFARALMRRTEPGKHYGVITAKALAVLEALLWGFHNALSGRCFPSYETIAARAGCARSTVAEAIKALEDAGVLTWVNRITRIREVSRDLFGHLMPRVRVIRISNAYSFVDPQPGRPALSWVQGSKSEFQSGTPIQDSISLNETAAAPQFDPDSPLGRALLCLGQAVGAVAR
jgi:Helix-turn-helix domain